VIKSLSKFLYILGEAKGKLVWLFLASITASLLEAIGIGLIGPFLSLASHPESIQDSSFLDWAYRQSGVQTSQQFISIVGLVIALVFCFKALVYFLVKAYIYRFSFSQKGKLCSKLIRAYLTVPYTFFLSRNTASIIRNIVIETDKFCYAYMLPLLDGSANLVVVIALIFLLGKTDLVFLAIASAVILPVFLLFYTLRKNFRHWGEEASESRNQMVRIINHSLGGVKETRLIGCEQYFEKQMDEQGYRYEIAESLFHYSQIIPRISIETILVLFLIILVSVSQSFSNGGLETLIPTLSVFAVASLRLIPAASQSIAAIGHLQNATYSVNAIYSDLKETQQQNNHKNLGLSHKDKRRNQLSSEFAGQQIMTFRDRIELRNITYSYPNVKSSAISNISLNLNKGESIALIGKSGAGKTTLVDVILGLLEPEKGDICVDGVSIYKDIRSWQNLIGYIPQSIFLMDDTIERNIAFGVPNDLIHTERMNKAIQAAQLTELIVQLPEGLQTVVGERGVRLSGGQRQRVGIARALYHEREILVLDEATSALDNETESLVNEAIRALSGTKTIIIIAHRLSTVEHCDRIYLLEGGGIVKSGSYQQVVVG
jgi:ABC-type multidrug transport system fused ATPase/permease subunit